MKDFLAADRQTATEESEGEQDSDAQEWKVEWGCAGPHRLPFSLGCRWCDGIWQWGVRNSTKANTLPLASCNAPVSHTHSLTRTQTQHATHIDKTSRTSRSHASAVFAVHARTRAPAPLRRQINIALLQCVLFGRGYSDRWGFWVKNCLLRLVQWPDVQGQIWGGFTALTASFTSWLHRCRSSVSSTALPRALWSSIQHV